MDDDLKAPNNEVVITEELKIGMEELFGTLYTCPQCDNECIFGDVSPWGKEGRFNYCPRCGVRLLWCDK